MPIDSPDAERERLPEALRRQRILSEVSRTLLDYASADEVEPLRRIVDKVTEALGDWCAFWLVGEDETMRLAVAYHPDPHQRELLSRFNAVNPPRRWEAGPPEYNVFLLRRPLIFERFTDEMLRLGNRDEEAYRLLKEVGLTSMICAPMFDGSRPLGSVMLVSVGEGGRTYTEDDVSFVSELAARAALAVRNARLVRQLAAERDLQMAARQDSDRRAAELIAILQADPNGVAMFDAQNRLSMASARLEELLEFHGEARIGTHYRDFFQELIGRSSHPDSPPFMAAIEDIFADPQACRTDDLELWPAGVHRWLRRTTTPVLSQSGEYLGRMFVYVDITAERELDQKRADFLTVAAHELRTPLTPLSMYLQSFELRLSRGQAVGPEQAARARRQITRLTKLVESLLDVSRLEGGRLELERGPVALDTLVAAVVQDFRSAAPQHELLLEKPATPVFVEGDRARLEQVVVNLLANAIKYSPQGGTVDVRVSTSQGEARVRVADQGIGIPAEEQGRLFQRFFRAQNAATRNFGGLGIGLFVSHQIVERHGGHFEVESSTGKGSSFTFCLPLAEACMRPRGRILLVDDDPAILEATSELLREWSYCVDEAPDGAAALELARGVPPDLVLVDLQMPTMDGPTLIRRLREEKIAASAPIVIFTAGRDAMGKAAQLGADAVLRKPFEIEELQEVVARLLLRAP